MGSVHYGARTAPAQVGPAVRAGSVRSEHYAGSVSRGAYRNPYRDEYFRHFRPGYRPFVFDDAQYYGYDSLPLGYEQLTRVVVRTASSLSHSIDAVWQLTAAES